MQAVELFLQVTARDARAAQVEQHEMIVRAARDEAEPALDKRIGQRSSILDHVFGIRPEFGLHRLTQAHGLGRDDVHERAALRAGKDGAVNPLAEFLLRQDHTAARAAQRLVRGGGDDVGIRHGAFMLAAGDQARDVRHVSHKERAVSVCDVGHGLEIDLARIGRRARNQQLGPVLPDKILNHIVIDPPRGGIDAVADAVVDLAREVHLRAVRQMAAVGKVHAHKRVAWLQKRGIDLEIGLRARVRLHVCKFCAEELLGARNRQRLQLVDIVAAAVITPARVALGVFIGEHRAHRRDDGRGGDVFRCDEFDILLLTGKFAADQRGNLGVRLLQIAGVVL